MKIYERERTGLIANTDDNENGVARSRKRADFNFQAFAQAQSDGLERVQSSINLPNESHRLA